MNHTSGSFGTSNFGSFYSYKYNGKELQETGMYDYGARMMMPDLGRWGAMDAMSEKYSSWSPYNYAINNPVMVIDPDGNDIQPLSEAQQAFKNYVATMSTGTETSGENIFTGFGKDDLMREYPDNYKGKLGQGDWKTSDRKNNTSRWQNANEYNIKQTNGSSEYADLDQRADFYRWFQSATDKKGFQTRWSGAAAETVDNLKNLIGNYDSYFGMDISNTEIRNFVKGGNKLILNHIWSSLQDLYNGPVLRGQVAANWDGQNLINEQHLIQPEYNKLSPASVKILNSNLSWFTSFEGSVLNLNHRYLYGMESMGYIVKWGKDAKINTNVNTR
ncbi:hypothetical protein LF887_07120 [Chryseobacterium sp. MEBOG06]|nr:hypothetical protein LF887_07120 [Chryseobacterium sp. MEBOG06]